MNPRSSSPWQDWRQFLRFGEELLEKNSALDQASYIEAILQQSLPGQFHVWLAEPFYPLPGEPAVDIIPSETCHPIILRVVKSGNSVTEPANAWKDPSVNVLHAAIPLKTQNNLLGVIEWIPSEHISIDQTTQNFLEGVAAHAAVSMQITRQVIIKKWRSEQLNVVGDVSAQIASVLDFDELCKRVTHLVRETFRYYYVAIFSLESDDSHLHLRASSHTRNTFPKVRLDVPLGRGMIGHAALTANELVAADVNQEPHYRSMDGLPETHSEAAIPLKIEDRVLGILDVQSDQYDDFKEADLIPLRVMADNIAVAMENARLYQKLQNNIDQISTVLEISHLLNSILDPDHLLNKVVEIIQSRFGYPYVHLFTVHHFRQKIIFRAGSGAATLADDKESIVYDLNSPQGIIPWVARTGTVRMVDDVRKEPLYRKAQHFNIQTRSELAIPLLFGDEVLGVLDIQSSKINAFHENDKTVLQALSASIAVTIRNANLYSSELWRRKVADSFKEVASLLTANLDLDNLFNTILLELDQNLPCEASSIWLLEEPCLPDEINQKTLKLAAVRNISANVLDESSKSANDIREWLLNALCKPEPTIRKPEDPYGPLGTALGFPSDYSSIAAPLRSGDKVMGLITMAHHSANRYGTEASAIITTFASYAAVAIQNARNYANAQEQAWTATVLLQVSESVQEITSLSDLLETVARLTPLLVGVERCAFLTYDPHHLEFVVHTTFGISVPEEKRHISIQTSPTLLRLINEKTPQFILKKEGGIGLFLDNQTDENDTAVILPLTAHKEILGACIVTHKADQSLAYRTIFDSHTLSILQGITHQTAVAMENIRLVEAQQAEAYVTAVLLQVAEAVVRQNDLAEIFSTVLHLLSILVGTQSAVLYLWDETKQSFQPAQVITPLHKSAEKLLHQTYPIANAGFLKHILEQDSAVILPVKKQQNDPIIWADLNPKITVDASSTNTYLIGHPLFVKNERYGVLISLESDLPLESQPHRIEILNGITQQMAVAIQNDQLQKQMLTQEVLEREVEVARTIQRTFLPSKLPQAPGWELDVRWATARQVGGDFYDVFRLPKNRIGLVIADVSDKGVPAALYMTVARTLIRAFAQNSDSPKRVLDRVNQLLMTDTPNGLFVTAIYAILDTHTGILTYSNAGHNLPLLIRSSGKEVISLHKGGIALGVVAAAGLEDHTIQLQQGDSLILYTDGLTETFSPEGESFGEERLVKLLKGVREKNICQIMELVETNLADFRQGGVLSDDLTLLAVQRLIH
jgi:serine phosphatase RsbU (regulator of sigma subunit)/putative methionine-R-sulfoxide reductase with GAF domain